MDENSTNALLIRVNKLEKDNRRMKKVCLAATVLGTAFIALGQSQTPRVIEANEFRLMDSKGTVRAKLATNGNAQTLFNLYSIGGDQLASIGVGTTGSNITLTGTDSQSSVSLFSGPMSVEPTLEIKGTAGKFAVTVDKDFGGPSFRVEDLDGYETVIGKSNLQYTKTGKKESTPAASIVLFDKDKKVLWSTP